MRIIAVRKTGLLGGLALGMAIGGCNSFDEQQPDLVTPRLVIPVDERPSAQSSVTPRSISGGTLSVLADGSAAIIADSDRDLVSVVDLTTLTVRHSIVLQAGDEPGRSIEDEHRRVHVALRGGGALLTLDPVSGAVVERRAVCKIPRGLAFEAATQLVHVACAEGKLVSLPAGGGEAVRTLELDVDLRDVLVRGSELWVTRFKSAEVLRVGAAGSLDHRVTMARRIGRLSQPIPADGSGHDLGIDLKPVNVEAGTAWRAIPAANGGATIVHQQAVVDDIDITEPSASGSAYGGGFDCSGIVKNVITTIAPDGTSASATVQGAPLPVDIAVSPDQQWVAVAHAGPADMQAPRPFLVFPDAGGASSGGGPTAGSSSLTLFSRNDLSADTECMFSRGGPQIQEPATAVAFTPEGRLLVYIREPSQLLVFTDLPWGASSTVRLPGDSRLDTGHELFHRDSGGGIACASCHPEGGEDGKTWRFVGAGERRTQALHVGLRGTAPFHWAGDLPDVGSLMSEVFVGRMGGVRQSEQRLGSLTEWLFSLTPPPAIRDGNDEAVARGRELFGSASVGCADCHSGAKLTNNESLAVDSRATTRLQVPSLVAIGYRAPFMHTGCAPTLAARFDSACGGDQHGNVASLSQDQRSDLVAYLESL